MPVACREKRKKKRKTRRALGGYDTESCATVVYIADRTTHTQAAEARGGGPAFREDGRTLSQEFVTYSDFLLLLLLLPLFTSSTHPCFSAVKAPSSSFFYASDR